jgi:hypothetical protein
MSVGERRGHPRRPFSCHARIEGLDIGQTPCRLTDISVGGVFVKVAAVLPVGARSRLRFRLGGREIVAETEVRNSVPGEGMGLSFVGLSPAEHGLILSFVIGRFIAAAS